MNKSAPYVNQYEEAETEAVMMRAYQASTQASSPSFVSYRGYWLAALQPNKQKAVSPNIRIKKLKIFPMHKHTLQNTHARLVYNYDVGSDKR